VHRAAKKTKISRSFSTA